MFAIIDQVTSGTLGDDEETLHAPDPEHLLRKTGPTLTPEAKERQIAMRKQIRTARQTALNEQRRRLTALRRQTTQKTTKAQKQAQKAADKKAGIASDDEEDPARQWEHGFHPPRPSPCEPPEEPGPRIDISNMTPVDLFMKVAIVCCVVPAAYKNYNYFYNFFIGFSRYLDHGNEQKGSKVVWATSHPTQVEGHNA